MKAKRIVVIGAGIGGLTAAYELKRVGCEVTVLEEDNRPGGRMSDVNDRRYKAKFTGATRFFPFYKDLWRLVDELQLRQYVVPAPTKGSVLVGSEQCEFDLRFTLSTIMQRSIGWRSRLSLPRLIPDLIRTAGRIDPQFISTAADWDDESTAEYVTRKIGKDFLENIIGVAYRNLLAWNVEESTKAFFFLFYHHLRGGPQYTFRGGIGHLPRALAERLDVLYGCKSVKVSYSENVARRSVTFSHAGEERKIEADIVICAIPGNRVEGVVKNLAPWEERFFPSVSYAQYAMVVYLLKRNPGKWGAATFMPRSAANPLSMVRAFPANPDVKDDLPKLWTVMGPDRTDHYVRPDGQNLDQATRHFLREIYPTIDDDIAEVHEMHDKYTNVLFPPGQARRVRSFLSIQESGPKNIYYVGDYLSNGTAGGSCASGARAARLAIDHWK